VGKYRKAVSSFPSQRVPKEVTRPSGELPGPKPTKKKHNKTHKTWPMKLKPWIFHAMTTTATTTTDLAMKVF